LQFRLLKGITNFLLPEQESVKGIGKSDHRVVFHLVWLMDADHMLGTSLLEYFSNKLRVACCDNY